MGKSRGTVTMKQEGESLRVTTHVGAETLFAPESIPNNPGASWNYWRGQGFTVKVIKNDGATVTLAP